MKNQNILLTLFLVLFVFSTSFSQINLDVEGDATISGKLGIGTNTATHPLHVDGYIRTTLGILKGDGLNQGIDKLDIYSNNNAGDSRSWIELWGDHTSRGGELTLAGTYLSFRANSDNTTTGSERMRINANGEVIIHSTLKLNYLNPGHTLNPAYEYIRFGDPSNYYAGFMHNNTSTTYGDGDDFTIFTYGNRDIVLSPSGTGNTYFNNGNVLIENNLAIGSNKFATGYELSVDGEIACEELLIDNDFYWPDYVFEDDYELLSIDAFAQSIENNGHLPGIPSAEVVEENGYHIGDMQIRTMEKLEELSLYIIQLHERIKALEAENEALKVEQESK